MTAGLLQLAAKGTNDIFITGDPQITLFKTVYRRHTNFTHYPHKLKFNKDIDFGGTGRCRLLPNGDLVYKVVLMIELPEIILEYPKLTKGGLAEILSILGINWNYVGDPDDPVTEEDYGQVVILVNMRIIEVLQEIEKLQNQIEVVTTEFGNYTTNGYDYANSVFPLLIVGDPYETLYNYLLSYNKDIPDYIDMKNTSNFDDINIGLYNKLIQHLITDDPNYLYLNDNVVFYHVIEFGNYIFNQSLLNLKMKYIFDKAVEFGYSETILDTGIDSNIVYNKYFNKLTGLREFMTNQQDINITRTEVLSDIEWNIRKNILQIINFINVLNRNFYNSNEQFRIGVFKKFKFITSTVFDGSDPMGLLTNTTNTKLADYFSSIITIPSSGAEPSSVTHYFGQFVAQAIQLFNTTIRDFFRTTTLTPYFADINIWKRLLLSTYLGNTPDEYGGFDNLYIMNLIPLFIVFDIPQMVNKYMNLDSELSAYTSAFDLDNTSFQAGIKASIFDMYLAYDVVDYDFDIKAYIREIGTSYRFGADRLLISMLKPEILLDINTSPYTSVLEPNINYTDMLPIEFVIESYVLQYKLMINNFTSDPVLRGKLTNLILNNVTKRFKSPIIPSYQTYRNNNYTLFSIETLAVASTIASEPPFLDAASSIWYSLQHSMIDAFNNLFINNLFSPSYYESDLGRNMTNALDLFKELLTDSGIPYDPNFIGFDFYKLTLSNPSTSAYGGLLSSYIDMFSKFNTMFAFYNQIKSLLQIRNAPLNRSRNFYRSFEDLFSLFENEILGNPDKYFPIGYGTLAYTGPLIPDLLSDIKDEFIDVHTIGAIDIKYEITTDLQDAVDNGPLNNNIYPIGSARHSWFTQYQPNIDNELMNQYNDIISIFKDDNTTTQYNDHMVQVEFSRFMTNKNIVDYFIDKVLKKSSLKKFLEDGVIVDSKLETFQHFLAILEQEIFFQLVILNVIAVEDPPGSNNWIYTGSLLEQQLVKTIFRTIPPFAWAKEIGIYLIEKIKLLYGDQLIEDLNADIIRNYNALSVSKEHRKGLDIMIGNVPELYTYNNKKKNRTQLYIPLIFSFCNHDSEALPIIGMTHSQPDILLTLKDLSEVAVWDRDAIFVKKPKLHTQLMAHYIYVEQEERHRLAESKLEYLYEFFTCGDIQEYTANNIIDNKISTQLYFKNSCKYILWQLRYLKKPSDTTPAEKIDWTNNKIIINDKVIKPIVSLKIKFNGRDRETVKEGVYYELVQPNKTLCGTLPDNCFMYNLCIDPLQLQPSGTANLGQINDLSIEIEFNKDLIADLVANLNSIKIVYYTYNYNWLRVMSGIGAPAFY